MIRQTFALAGLFALITCASSLQAQSGAGFDLTWSTVDGGGLMSSNGGGFAVSGTIGQADAQVAPIMNGGGFELTGGFWPVTLVCYCPGDMNGDGKRDGADVQKFVACLIAGGNCSCADLDATNGVTIADVSGFVANLLATTPCP